MSIPPQPLPAHLAPLYTRPQIETRLLEMAPIVDGWAAQAEAETGRHLLVVCLLRGGVFFFSDLLLRMTHSVEPGFCRAWSYVKGKNDQPETTCRLDWQGLDVRERDVLLVDNICDSGRTLAATAIQAEGTGAHRVRSVAMVHRVREDSVHTPTLSGFIYPGKEWLVGYGLRDQDSRANWPAIYKIIGSGA